MGAAVLAVGVLLAIVLVTIAVVMRWRRRNAAIASALAGDISWYGVGGDLWAVGSDDTGSDAGADDDSCSDNGSGRGGDDSCGGGGCSGSD
jgi:hypothetical protein